MAVPAGPPIVRRVGILDTVVELRLRRPGEAAAPLPQTPGPSVIIDAVHAPGRRDGGGASGLRYEREGGALRRIVVERPGVRGAFTPTASGFTGELTVGASHGELLDGIMGLGLSLLCEARGALLLHASAVVRSDRACLFLGAGGAGKTTIATELNGGRETLCVDRALVAADAAGGLRVWSTPFSEADGAPARPESAAIAGLFFVEQAAGHELRRLSRWEATGRALRNLFAPSRDPAPVQRTLELVGRLVDLDVAYGLRFRRDAGFWPLIERALGKGV